MHSPTTFLSLPAHLIFLGLKVENFQISIDVAETRFLFHQYQEIDTDLVKLNMIYAGKLVAINSRGPERNF